MKTLIKLAKARKRLPTLMNVKADESYITATDLDIWITEPRSESIEAGKMYLPHGLNTDKPLESDIPTSDFPAMKDIGIIRAEFCLTPLQMKNFAWVAKAMSKEEVRFYICGICFHRERMIATDGHRLHMMEMTHDVGDEKFIVPSDAVKYIIDLAAENKGENVCFIFGAQGLKVNVGAMSLVARYIDGTYPDYERVIPNIKKREKAGAWDSVAMAAIYKDAKPLFSALRSRSKAVRLTYDGKLVVLGYEHKNRVYDIGLTGSFDIGFNAAYLADMCSGDLYFGDYACDPVVFKADNLTGVLMPLRV